jgi:glycosyltransferase involved in cell wall biosynthesis
MVKPLISIVTISFNQKQFLKQAIESVLTHKNSDTEYIIVDPGSTDGSRELISSYANRIDHVIFEKDQGPADGLNKGFKVARGEIGYFLNSDDFLLPHALSVLRNFWSTDKSTDVLLCNGWMVNETGKPLRELRAHALTLAKLINPGCNMFQQGMSFRIEAFQNCGGFNGDNRTCWDFELLCALLANQKQAHHLDARVGAFRMHSASLTGGSAGERHQARYTADMLRIARKYGGSRQATSPLARFLDNPMRHFFRLCDTCIPHRMARRFAADCARI